MKPWNWCSNVQARDVYAAPKRITAMEALDACEVRRVLSGVRRNRCRVAALLSVLSAVTWHHRGRSDHHARYLQETVHMHSLRQRPARIVAALCGLIALLVLGVSSAAVDAPAPQPRIIPLSGSMTLGGTSTVTTALLSPEVASASPTVKAPHK